MCVLLCCIKHISWLGNHYDPRISSRASQGACTHDLESPTYRLALSSLREPRVTQFSPFTLTASLAAPIPSTSNGPTTTTLTTRSICLGGFVVWAVPKFVRPHRWGSWMIIRFLGFLWSQVLQNSPGPPPTTKTEQYLFVQKTSKERHPLQRGWGPKFFAASHY